MNNKTLGKVYLKLMSIPSIIFIIILIFSLLFIHETKKIIGFILISLSLYIIVALRNLYVVMSWDSKDKKD